MPYRSPCAFNLPADPTAQTHAFDRRAQGGFAVQFRLGARQNFSVEGAVGLLAGLGAKFQIAVDAPAEGALQLRGRPSLKMNHISKPCDCAGKRLVLGIEIDWAGGITLYSIMACPSSSPSSPSRPPGAPPESVPYQARCASPPCRASRSLWCARRPAA